MTVASEKRIVEIEKLTETGRTGSDRLDEQWSAEFKSRAF